MIHCKEPPRSEVVRKRGEWKQKKFKKEENAKLSPPNGRDLESTRIAGLFLSDSPSSEGRRRRGSPPMLASRPSFEAGTRKKFLFE